MTAQRRNLDKRTSVCVPFRGPSSALGGALRPLMVWVFKNYRQRLSEVTVCHAERPTQLVFDEDPLKVAEFRFDLDRHLPYDVKQKLPGNAEVKDLPAETILIKAVRGDLETVTDTGHQWIAAAAKSNRVAAGYRERYVKIGDNDSPDWEIEFQLLARA